MLSVIKKRKVCTKCRSKSSAESAQCNACGELLPEITKVGLTAFGIIVIVLSLSGAGVLFAENQKKSLTDTTTIQASPSPLAIVSIPSPTPSILSTVLPAPEPSPTVSLPTEKPKSSVPPSQAVLSVPAPTPAPSHGNNQPGTAGSSPSPLERFRSRYRNTVISTPIPECQCLLLSPDSVTINEYGHPSAWIKVSMADHKHGEESELGNAQLSAPEGLYIEMRPDGGHYADGDYYPHWIVQVWPSPFHGVGTTTVTLTMKDRAGAAYTGEFKIVWP